MKDIATAPVAPVALKPVEPTTFKVHDMFPECAEQICGENVKVLGFKHNVQNSMSIMVPKHDDCFVFSPDVLLDIIVSHRSSNNQFGMYLSGPTGCGKSSSVRQYCARLGIGLTNVTADRNTELNDFLGSRDLQDGRLSFKKGPLLQAMEHGMWFLLDEIDLLDPGVATKLNGILDGNGYLIPESGEFVPTHPLFRFFATGNTFGEGMSEEYLGTQKQNKALLDRFTGIRLEYPDKEVELAILKKACPQNEPAHAKMVMYANEIRDLHAKGKYGSVPISTRSLVKWARLALAYKGFSLGGQDLMKYAWERAILFSADETGKAILMSHYFNYFKA